MMTAKQVVAKAKADKCKTASRGSSKKKHRNYSNKYTQLLGKLGYKGIRKDGYFTKFYPYGVVGHCCIFVLYWLIMCGYKAFVPKKGYIWNTNAYAKWLKKKPTIKGYGKVGWTKDPKKAKVGAVCFKGKKGKSNYTHTCLFLKYEDGYVYTVDGNVSGKYKGKRINNGVVKKRKASSFSWGFANMPYKKAPKKTYKAGHVYVLQHEMYVRANHSVKSKKLGTMPKGKKVSPLKVYNAKNGVWWVQVPFKDTVAWVCAKTPKKMYLK